MTPTLSLILAISETDSEPLLAQKKSSHACPASLSFVNSELPHDTLSACWVLSTEGCLPEERVQPLPKLGSGEHSVVWRFRRGRER